MALCYEIPYTDRFGAHTAQKWGESPAAAAAFVSAALGGRGTPAEVGTPQLVAPQPFGVVFPAVVAPRASAPADLTRARTHLANAESPQLTLI